MLLNNGSYSFYRNNFAYLAFPIFIERLYRKIISRIPIEKTVFCLVSINHDGIVLYLR